MSNPVLPCNQACAAEMEACRAAWRGLAALPSAALDDPRAVAFLAGVGEVLVAAAIVRATARAHQVLIKTHLAECVLALPGGSRTTLQHPTSVRDSSASYWSRSLGNFAFKWALALSAPCVPLYTVSSMTMTPCIARTGHLF